VNYPDSAKVPAIWEVGDVILDLYEVKQVFTGGGMGLVYRVHHRGWNMDLAVKSPRPEFFQSPAQIENFEREAETWVNLGLHPCTVSCYYVRRLGGIPRLFAEFIDGGNLADSIRSRALYEGGPGVALERILDIAIQTAWGLQHAHQQGLIHQDVKPANVLMSADGAVTVTDFGLAKAQAVANESAVPNLGQSMLATYGGMTPAYCSPEQAEIAAQSRSGMTQNEISRLTRRTDIWSWALCVLEMFMGEPPCPMGGQAAAHVFEEYLDGESSELGIPKMPESLVEVLRHCFQRNPADRPQEMAQAANSLKDIYQQVVGREYPRRGPKAIEAAADGLNNRALSLLDLGKQEEAEKLFDEALRRHPEHAEATYNRGIMLWRSAHGTDAKLTAELEILRQAKPNDWKVAYLLGLVHSEQTDKEGAVQVLEEAVDLGGQVDVMAALETARSVSAAQLSRSVRKFKGHQWEVWSVCLSSDNLLALSGSRDKTLRLWDVATGRCLRTFEGHTHSISSVCFSLDNRRALSGSLDNTLRLWNAETGECLRVFKDPEWDYELESDWGDPDMVFVNFACLSSDNKYALWARNNALRLWDVDTGQCLRIFEGHVGHVESVCLSSDNRWALSGSTYGDKGLRLWDVATGQCLRIFEGHTEGVNSVCLSLDNRLALSGSDDKTLRVWDVGTGQCLRIFVGHTGEVNSVRLSSDGTRAISGSDDDTVRVWDVTTGQCLRTLDLHTAGRGGVNSIYLSSDNRWAISGNEDHTLRLWDVRGLTSAGLRKQAPFLLCHIVAVRVAADTQSRFDQCVVDGKKALSSHCWSNALEYASKARSIRGYEASAEALKLWNDAGLHSFRRGFRAGWEFLTFKGHTSDVESVCVSSDNQWALSGSRDNTLRLWDMATGRCLRVFEGHTGGVNSVCPSSDNRWALSGSTDSTLRLWDVTTGQCLRIFEGHAKGITSVCLSSDSRWALSGSADETLRFWDVATGKCLRTLKGHPQSTVKGASICLSADNLLFLTGSWTNVDAITERGDKNLRLWNLATGEWRHLSKSDTSAVAFCLSSDNKWALSASRDGIRLWSVTTGECHRVFEGHSGGMNSLCMSSDNRWVLSGGSDMALSERTTGRCLRVFKGHTGRVKSVCLSSDNRWALSGGYDNTIRLWELDWEFESREQADWDEGARFVLANFLTLHRPYAAELPTVRQPTEDEITRSLTRSGTPSWNESDFKQLLHTLACAGYGWLKPEGVRKELMNMAATWTDFAHRPLQAPFTK